MPNLLRCFLALFVANLKFWLNSAHLKICIRQTIGYWTMSVFSDCMAKILFTYDLVYEGFLVKLWGCKALQFFSSIFLGEELVFWFQLFFLTKL
jgi:hypothetical protein